MTGDDVTSGADGLTFTLLPQGVGVLTFDRPEQMNSVDWPLYQAIEEAFTRLAERSDVLVIVLRGSGRAFCAGGDISFMRQMYEAQIDKVDVADLALRVFTAQLALPQPTLAVVDGPAIGLGATLALCCDLVFAGEAARFADPHVQMGLVPGDGGALVWPMLVGPHLAKEFLFTGDAVHAAEAHRIGLVNRVYPSSEVYEQGIAFATRLAAGPTETINAIKVLINRDLCSLGAERVRQSLALETRSQESEYHRRAVGSFLQGALQRF